MFTLSQKCSQIVLIFVLFFSLSITVKSQSSGSKIDYSIRSNILDSDTLKGDQKAIFNRFIELSSREVMTKYTPSQLKAEFRKLGIIPEEKQRFYEAYKFYSLTMEAHKEDCEMWETFKELDPRRN